MPKVTEELGFTHPGLPLTPKLNAGAQVTGRALSKSLQLAEPQSPPAGPSGGWNEPDAKAGHRSTGRTPGPDLGPPHTPRLPRPVPWCLSPPHTCICLPKAEAIPSPGLPGPRAPGRPSSGLSDGEPRLAEAAGPPFPSPPMADFLSSLCLCLSLHCCFSLSECWSSLRVHACACISPPPAYALHPQ